MKLKHNWNGDCEWTLSLFTMARRSTSVAFVALHIFGAVAKDLEQSSGTI
jgi:hypothetical protein